MMSHMLTKVMLQLISMNDGLRVMRATHMHIYNMHMPNFENHEGEERESGEEWMDGEREGGDISVASPHSQSSYSSLASSTADDDDSRGADNYLAMAPVVHRPRLIGLIYGTLM